MLRVAGRWVWDSWCVDDGERFHLFHPFHLWAPASLGDPALCHVHAGVAHAVSEDLVTWEALPDALAPRADDWDDLAIWTGCTVLGDDARWRMFYTALSHRGHGERDQRIGVAYSDDLTACQRPHHQPLVPLDPRWYRTLIEDPGASDAWRDPHVFRDPSGAGWHMILTARAAHGQDGDDGVLGHAGSADLETRVVGPPLSRPGTGFGQLEVSQVHEVDGRWVLLFSGHPSIQTPSRLARHATAAVPACYLWSVVSDSPTGPWRVDLAEPFTAEPRLFAGPLVRCRDGAAVLLGFRQLEEDGIPPLEIIDPIPVGVRGDRFVALAS